MARLPWSCRTRSASPPRHPRMRYLSVTFLVLLALGRPAGAADSASPDPAVSVFHHEHVLGTSLDLKIVTATPAGAARAEAAFLTEVDRLAAILSTYEPASEISRWLATTDVPVRVSPELFEVLGLFDQWRIRSGGALDAAAGSIAGIWQAAAAHGRPPSDETIAAAVTSVRQVHWTLDAATRSATHRTRTPLVFNTFAKSYIASRACDAAQRAAHPLAMVANLGGDVVVRGDLTETIHLANPRADAENDPPIATLRVRNQTVATSGDYRRGLMIGGKWFSHLVDPRTGRPTDHVMSATVVAGAATDAGALATACCVLEPAAGLRLVASVPGADCLLVTKDGSRLASPGWSAVASPARADGDVAGVLAASRPPVLIDTAPATPPPASPAAPVPAPAKAAAAWDEAMELVVTLELAAPAGRRAPRPFVAVWIEDADKYPVRTLALWFNGGRWLPDLRQWHHGDQLRALAEGTDLTKTVAAATRPPGKYTLRWDGKDNAGKPVAAGKYTVCIETAREHGTHQLIRQELDCGGVAAKAEAKANPEVTAATFDYHRKANGN